MKQLNTMKNYLLLVIMLLLGTTTLFGQQLTAPTNLVTTPGNTSVSISLTAPSGVVSNYQWSFDGGTTWVSRIPASNALPLVIDGIQTDTTHTVRLRAVGDQDVTANPNTFTSGLSSTSSVFTTAALTAPLGLTTVIGNETLTIQFTPPTDDGGNSITSYQYTTNGGTSWTTVALTSVSSVVGSTTRKAFTIASLTNGTQYTVVVRAVNTLGAGESSESVQSTPATIPTAPAITLLTPSNDGFSVVFNSPSTNGGQSITNYQYSVDNGTTWSTPDPEITTSPLTIEGLTQSTLYRVRLRAVNGVGSGTTSASIQGTTHTLNAPTVLVGTVTSAMVSITFTAPTLKTAGTITDYEYTLDNGTTWVSSASATTTVVITGLTNGTTYSIKLRAVNSGGKGLSSTTLTATPRNNNTVAGVQFFHNVNVGTVSVTVDGDELVEELTYQSTTDFLSLPAAKQIVIRLVNGTSVVDSLTTTLTFGKNYQVFVVGGSSGKSVEFVVTDVVRTVSTQANQIQYRFVHGITSTERVTLERVTTSTPRQPIQLIALNGEYKSISSYLGHTEPGYTTLQLSSNGEVLGRFLFNFGEFEGKVVTFVGTGVVGSTLNVLGFEVDGTKIPSSVTTSDEDVETELPSQFTLYSNFPNPFNPTTNIKFDLPESANVKIQVVDVLGRQVLEMNEGTLSSGQKVVTLDGSRLSSGVYYYKVVAEGSTKTYSQGSKFTLVK